ncbi:hypothetical protein CRV15_31220 (plasmid) [Streptomyces clavuligerus]|nr:hypothetical protein [Streptomyces clavuligerus]QCS10919.1 hypothetical protein CRV15_31220 [Streptomyces clavuligerus]QPJ98488.1 hypothetical protein GE265_33230 [Streptomyces clavuligerus]
MPRGSVAAPEPRTAPDGDWNRRLADAFAVLLGRPLREYGPDAVHAASIDGNLLYETGFRQDPAWVRPEALSGAEPVVWDCPVFDEAERVPHFDASGSVFEILAPEGEATALPEDFVAALDAVCFGRRLLRGADLVPLLDRYGVDLTDPALAGNWTVFFPRLVSDGTLLDALRAALDLGHGPDDLLSLTAEPDEEWAERLAAIEHPGLRAHLGHFCTDGEEGLMPVFDDDRAGGLKAEGCEQVIGWEDGHGQVDIRVVRLSDRVAGVRRAPDRPGRAG